MPNWIEGSLKIKGTPENVNKFIDECLVAYSRSSGVEPEALPKVAWCEIDEFDDCYDILVDLHPGTWVHINDTRRAFLGDNYSEVIRVYNHKSAGNDCFTAIPIKQAWDFNKDDWIAIAQKYQLHVKLFGIEKGMGFYRDLDIYEDGTVYIDNRHVFTSYDDFIWECPLPWIGG